MEEVSAGEARKRRSIGVLEARGIPYIEHLPVIFVDDSDAPIKPEAEVKKRLIATTILGVYGESRDRDLLADLISRFGAAGYFSPNEQAMIDDTSPSDQDIINAVWRYEVAWLLLWALGFRDEVTSEQHIADVPGLAATMRELGSEGVFAHGRLRPAADLLDYGDLIYRIDWACVNARINGQPAPQGLDSGVVVERHYAMNWLTGVDLDWDDVATNT